MKIRLGYVAIATTLDNITSSHTMTYSNYRKLGKKRGNEKLLKVINDNLDSLLEILKYNLKNEIYFYRMSSNIFPLATIPELDIDLLTFFKDKLKNIGHFINSNQMRVDMHVDHYFVLNSINKDVVLSTINILNFYKNIFKAMEVDGKLIMHIGSKTNGKRKSIERFITNFNLLDDSVKQLIIIENDDKVYNIKNTLSLCQKINVPMVLDYHHYLCNKGNYKIEDYIETIFNTWGNSIPKIHFSSPLNKINYRSHHDYIDIKTFLLFLAKIKFCKRNFDIMIEAKAKDEALFRLVRQIKYYSEYFFEKNTIFYI